MKTIRHILFLDYSFPIRFAAWTLFITLPLIIIFRLLHHADLIIYTILISVLLYTFTIPIYYIGYFQKKFLWGQALLGFAIIFVILLIAEAKLIPSQKSTNDDAAGMMILAFTILYYPAFLVITSGLRWISEKINKE